MHSGEPVPLIRPEVDFPGVLEEMVHRDIEMERAKAGL
jgi:hypothetical protein